MHDKIRKDRKPHSCGKDIIVYKKYRVHSITFSNLYSIIFSIVIFIILYFYSNQIIKLPTYTYLYLKLFPYFFRVTQTLTYLSR